MQDLIVDFMRLVNVPQLLAMAAMWWFFYSRLDRKIEKCQYELENQMEKSQYQLEKLSDKVEDIDRRLCRIEGSLSHSYFMPPREWPKENQG